MKYLNGFTLIPLIIIFIVLMNNVTLKVADLIVEAA